MRQKISRRRMLVRTGQVLALGSLNFSIPSPAGVEPDPDGKFGVVAGEAVAGRVGERILAAGGNAVDAAVAAALAAGVASPHHCGAGGYGGHMVVSLNGGKHVSCIDFNTAAAAAARPDMYSFDEKRNVQGEANRYGWLASGVPGTLAGLQMAIDKFGTHSFRELVQPAIALARDGTPMDLICAGAIRGAAPRLRQDRGSTNLYLTHGDSPNEGDLLVNPELAEMLSTLAKRNSVHSFYHGDIAQQIADAFQKHGGMVTARDLAKYRAREVKPLGFQHEGFKIFTAPLTAGGLTALEGLSVLQAMNWTERPSSPAKTHAQLETLRLVWKDRLELLGDATVVKVPVEQLLSSRYAHILAEQADQAAQSRRPLGLKIDAVGGGGTTNISSVDRHGNLAAVTLTHGGDFGAQVTVEGLGLTLGQGMYKFNPHPLSPNAPGPGKRPLENMCPTIIHGPGLVSVAVGGAGGVMIPNALFAFLVSHVLQKQLMADALISPRMHTMGNMDVIVDASVPTTDTDYLKQLGFNTRVGPSARLSAVSFNAASGEMSGGMR